MGSGDFYTTTAEVIPVLLLALVWGTRYLDELKEGRNNSARIFKKPVVAVWGTLMTLLALFAEGMMILVVADVVDDCDVWKAVGIAAVGALLVTMAVRIITDIRRATK